MKKDETPVLKASAASIDIPKVNNYLARLGQTQTNEESESSINTERLKLSILIKLTIDQDHSLDREIQRKDV